MAKSFTSLDDIKSAIEGMGFKIGNVWFDGNVSRPVFICSREGLPHDIEVWAESPKYVNGVTIKDVSARDFDMVDGGEDAVSLKKAIKKALAYMGVKESNMKITVKEAKIYTVDDFKAAAEEERFKNRAEIWADQFNRHAEYIGLKDRARVEKDIHGCDSVVWDYGYIVAKDPFGDKWQVRFGDNAYTLDKTKVTPYLYKQMDSMTGFKGEAKKQERQGYADNDVRLNGEDLVFVVTGVTTEDRGYDLAVSVKEGETYTLDELGYEISGMCENCNGYPTATRYDDILVVAIQAPIENDDGELTEDYWDAVVIEGYVKVVGDKLDDVAAYLEG